MFAAACWLQYAQAEDKMLAKMPGQTGRYSGHLPGFCPSVSAQPIGRPFPLGPVRHDAARRGTLGNLLVLLLIIELTAIIATGERKGKKPLGIFLENETGLPERFWNILGQGNVYVKNDGGSYESEEYGRAADGVP